MSDKKEIQTRAVKAYPSPKYSNLVKAYSSVNDMSKSKVVTAAVKQFFDTMPADQRQKLSNNTGPKK